MDKLLEMFKPVCAVVADENIGYGDPDSDYVNFAKYREGVFALAIKAGAGTLTVKVKAATSAAGGSAEAIAARYRKLNVAGSPVDTMGDYTALTTSGLVTSANDNAVYFIEVREEDLPAGKPFVCINLDQTAVGEVIGSCVAYMGGARFRGNTLPSAVS